MDSLIALAHDPYLPAFNALIPGLVEAYDTSTPKDPKLKDPIDVLRKWDYKTSKESVAMTLAHYYGTLYGQLGNIEDDLDDMELMVYFGTKSPKAERLLIFNKVITALNDDFGRWNLPWGEVNRYQRLNADIVQAFDDDRPSIPIAFASGRWVPLPPMGRGTTTIPKKSMVLEAIAS